MKKNSRKQKKRFERMEKIPRTKKKTKNVSDGEDKEERKESSFFPFSWFSSFVYKQFFYDYLVDPASDICLFKRLSHANMRRRIYFRILWMALYKCGNESERQKAGDNDGKTVDNTRSAIRTV